MILDLITSKKKQFSAEIINFLNEKLTIILSLLTSMVF